MIGVVIGARSADKNIDGWKALLIGVVFGVAAGFLVFLIDRPSSQSGEDTDAETTDFDSRSRGVVPRFLVLLSLALVWAPVVGTCFALIAVVVNWRAPGLPRKLSILGFVLPLPITLFLLYAIFVAEPGK